MQNPDNSQSPKDNNSPEKKPSEGDQKPDEHQTSGGKNSGEKSLN